MGKSSQFYNNGARVWVGVSLPWLTLRATYLRQRTKHDDFLDEKTLRNFENGSGGLGDKLDGVWQFSFSCIRFFKLSK